MCSSPSQAVHILTQTQLGAFSLLSRRNVLKKTNARPGHRVRLRSCTLCRVNTKDSCGVWMRLTLKRRLSLHLLVQRIPPSCGCGSYSSCMSYHTPPLPRGAGLSSHLSMSITFHLIHNNYLRTRVSQFLLVLAGF